MAVRTVTITEAAYERLATMRRPGESFTDAVLRLTGRSSLARLSQMLTPAESAAVAEAILAARDERTPQRRRA